MNKNKGKIMNKNKILEWGSPEYIQELFDDVQSVRELSRKCVTTKAVKAAVANITTKKDNLSVRSVMQFIAKGPDGKVSDKSGFMAVLDLGLNGGGKQADYFDCLKKVAKAGFSVIDAHVDILDDVGSVIVSFADAKYDGKAAKKEAK